MVDSSSPTALTKFNSSSAVYRCNEIVKTVREGL